MSESEYSAEQIKIIFAKRSRRFYALNLLVLGLTVVVLLVFKDDPYYPWVFGLSVPLLLLWIFNADRFCLCPVCEQVPRGREGLIAKPKQCAKCGVALS